MKRAELVPALVLILHNIRSVYNVGAIFRTADALGISKIYLTGYTPTPLDRFGRPRSDFAKSALGSEMTMPWETADVERLVRKLKEDTFQIIGIEQDRSAVDYKKVRPSRRTAVILGNEVRGISSSLKKKCDVLAEIPMRGKKESLNVSVAAGIVLFRWFDK